MSLADICLVLAARQCGLLDPKALNVKVLEACDSQTFGARCLSQCLPGYVAAEVNWTDRDAKTRWIRWLTTWCRYQGLEADILCAEDGNWTRASPCVRTSCMLAYPGYLRALPSLTHRQLLLPTAVDCGPYQPLIPGQVNQVDTVQLALIDTGDCDNFFEAEPCQPSCKGGQPSVVSGALTCQPDGTWSGTFECQGKSLWRTGDERGRAWEG